MNLNHVQKNYIKKHRKHQSAEEIAKHLNVSEEIVRSYLKEKWGEKHDNLNEKNSFAIFNFRHFLRANKVPLFFLTILVIIVYANALFNDFVSDDRGIIINANNLSYALANPLTVIRPLINFFAYHVGGLSPFLYRFPNIVFHIGSVLLVFAILYLITKRKIIALVAASLFAVHPILIEGITWISGGVYAQYSFFFLLSFLFYILSSHSKKFYWFSIGSYVLALFSAEKASVLFLILIVYEFIFGDIKNNWKKLLPYIGISMLYAFLYYGRIGSRVETLQVQSGGDTKGVDNIFVLVPIAITSYLQLILWPDGLTLYHSEMQFAQFEYIVRSLVFVVLLGVALFSFKKNKMIFFWICFFIIPLLPMLTPFRITWVVAERYAYLGSIGIFAMVAFGVSKLSEIKKMRVGLYIICSLILLSLSIRTIVRNIDWKNEDNLWIATGKTSPSSPNTHNNLGDVYGRHGDLVRSSEEFKRAIQIKPNYADAWHNLGNVYRQMGKVDDALKSYQTALTFNPNIWQSYTNIASIYFEKGKYDLALENINNAIKLNPTNEDLYIGKGIVYIKMGNKTKAREMFSLILRADPTNQKAQAGLNETEKMKE